jgi:hypothetical protein
MGTLPPRFSSTNTRPSINGHDPARSTGCRPADLPNGCHPTGGITWRGHERYKYQGVQQKISTGGNLFDHRLAVPRNQKQDSKYWEHPGIQTVDEVDGNDLINYRAAAWQRQFKAKHKVQSIERAAAWQKQGQFTSKTQSTSNERRITNNFPKGHTSNTKTHLQTRNNHSTATLRSFHILSLPIYAITAPPRSSPRYHFSTKPTCSSNHAFILSSST